MCEEMWTWAGQYNDHAFCEAIRTTLSIVPEEALLSKQCKPKNEQRLIEWIRALPECGEYEYCGESDVEGDA
jgi:hypothetical protein